MTVAFPPFFGPGAELVGCSLRRSLPLWPGPPQRRRSQILETARPTLPIVPEAMALEPNPNPR